MVGVFALQSRAFPTIPATRWPELLLWAVGFGAAQQTITRFVDQRVRGLVGEGAPDLSVDESGAAATGADGARNGGSSEDYAIRTSGLRVQAATTHRKEAR
jgi:hypothetical protein